MEKLLNYINVLSERNIKRQSSSGFTLWALLAFVVYLTSDIGAGIFSIIKFRVQYNYVYLLIAGEFNFLYWFMLGSISVVYLLSPETKRAFSSLELFYRVVYNIFIYTIYMLFIFININAVYIAYHDRLNYWIYIVNAGFFTSNIIISPIKKIKHFLALRSNKKLSLVDIDELEIKSKALNVTYFITTLLFSISGMVLMVLFFNIDIFDTKYLDANNIIIKMGAEIFLLFVLIMFIVKRMVEINKISWLEKLEKDIYIYNLSEEEIKSRLEKDYFGSTPLGWLNMKKNDILKIQEEWFNYLNACLDKLSNIDSEPISVSDKKDKFNLLSNDINKYNELMRYKSAKIYSVILSYLKRNATSEEFGDIKKITTEILTDKDRIKRKSDEIYNLRLKYMDGLSNKTT